ncbi:DUF3108 domain-containing protein [Limnobacter humi]|uniref:DUF3108 domain-containing protein n=1 Tax=Limnobacter humi TaxID=1778671 RepID=A0ABT1WJF5_9BURK|nr:DUF3108 domain-containing protein [Limnobacter humi]MCQ8897642.1 DUF3108 domain-containing protein [Limnobacter humi]
MAWSLALLAGHAHAALECGAPGKALADADLQYSLTHSQVPGQLAVSLHTLRVAGNHYTLESVSQAKGLMALMFSGQLTQKSEGLVDTKLGFVPLYYAEKRGKKPLVESVVNEAQQEVQFKKNNTAAPLEKGLQDRLSMIHQIAAQLRCGAPAKAGDELKFRVIGTGRIGTEWFVLKGTEDVVLNLGEREQTVVALKFESKPDEPGDDIVRVWYGKQLGWQPVRIQIQDADGKSLTQTLTGLNRKP